jgi:chromosome segregation ATPase
MHTEYASIYEGHRQARREHSPWLCEIERLRAKNNKALGLLAQIEGLARQYEADLQMHAAEISAHELEIQLDELVTAQHEHTQSGAASERLATVHEQFEEDLTELQAEAKQYKELRGEYADKVKPLLEAFHRLV